MAIEDLSVVANHKHEWAAKRIADRIAMDAGKNYPREALEAAKGIETVLEVQIKKCREDYEFALEGVKNFQENLYALIKQDDDHQKSFSEQMGQTTDLLNRLYVEIDEIVPTSVFPSSLIDDPNVTDPEAAEHYKDALDALSFDESVEFSKNQERLKRVLKNKNKLLDWDKEWQEAMPPKLKEARRN